MEGAWTLQEYSYAKSPAPVRLNKPTGMLLVNGNHYAFVILRESSPRTDIGVEGQNATADQLRATWGPLQAQAGTIQVSGNTLTLRASVAKGVPPMAKGSFSKNAFTLKGDTLLLVSTRSETGPTTNARTWRFIRAKSPMV